MSELFLKLKGIDDDGNIAFISRVCEVGGVDMARFALLLLYMFDGVDGEIGDDFNIGDNDGEGGGVDKGDDGWDIMGDPGCGASQVGGLNLPDLVPGASVALCGFCDGYRQYMHCNGMFRMRFSMRLSRAHDGVCRCSRWSQKISRWSQTVLAKESEGARDGGER